MIVATRKGGMETDGRGKERWEEEMKEKYYENDDEEARKKKCRRKNETDKDI